MREHDPGKPGTGTVLPQPQAVHHAERFLGDGRRRIHQTQPAFRPLGGPQHGKCTGNLRERFPVRVRTGKAGVYRPLRQWKVRLRYTAGERDSAQFRREPSATVLRHLRRGRLDSVQGIRRHGVPQE